MSYMTEEESWDIYVRFLLREVKEIIEKRDTKKLFNLAEDIIVDFEEYVETTQLKGLPSEDFIASKRETKE